MAEFILIDSFDGYRFLVVTLAYFVAVFLAVRPVVNELSWRQALLLSAAAVALGQAAVVLLITVGRALSDLPIIGGVFNGPYGIVGAHGGASRWLVSLCIAGTLLTHLLVRLGIDHPRHAGAKTMLRSCVLLVVGVVGASGASMFAQGGPISVLILPLLTLVIMASIVWQSERTHQRWCQERSTRHQSLVNEQLGDAMQRLREDMDLHKDERQPQIEITTASELLAKLRARAGLTPTELKPPKS